MGVSAMQILHDGLPLSRTWRALSFSVLCRGVDIKPDYANVASVVFSSPQVAQVGVNEDKAVEEYGDVDVFTSTFSYVPSKLYLFALHPICHIGLCALCRLVTRWWHELVLEL